MLQRSVTEIRNDLSGRPNWSVSGEAGKRGSPFILGFRCLTHELLSQPVAVLSCFPAFHLPRFPALLLPRFPASRLPHPHPPTPPTHLHKLPASRSALDA